MPDPIDLAGSPRPGLLLLVSDENCFLCRAPKVYAEPSKGLSEATGQEVVVVCMNAPCPAAIKAKPLLDNLRRVLRAMKR